VARPPALGVKVLDSWEYQQSVNNTIHVQLLINTLTLNRHVITAEVKVSALKYNGMAERFVQTLK